MDIPENIEKEIREAEEKGYNLFDHTHVSADYNPYSVTTEYDLRLAFIGGWYKALIKWEEEHQ